jgi:hypothetical protein
VSLQSLPPSPLPRWHTLVRPLMRAWFWGAYKATTASIAIGNLRLLPHSTTFFYAYLNVRNCKLARPYVVRYAYVQLSERQLKSLRSSRHDKPAGGSPKAAHRSSFPYTPRLR